MKTPYLDKEIEKCKIVINGNAPLLAKEKYFLKLNEFKEIKQALSLSDVSVCSYCKKNKKAANTDVCAECLEKIHMIGY